MSNCKHGLATYSYCEQRCREVHRDIKMDKISKEEFLAVNVMGWKYELSKITNKPCKTGIYMAGEDLDSCDSWMESCHWNPSSDIEQAHMLLDKFEGMVQIGRGDKPDWWNVSLNGMNPFVDDVLTFAITEAVLIESGYYND